MGVFPGIIQGTVCGSYLPKQCETRVSYFEAKVGECDKIFEGIHSIK